MKLPFLSNALLQMHSEAVKEFAVGFAGKLTGFGFGVGAIAQQKF
ncbi:MAG: hypothetical protein AAF889_13370 [Cyanobacteria bacterium P01_D01_bin.73]